MLWNLDVEYATIRHFRLKKLRWLKNHQVWYNRDLIQLSVWRLMMVPVLSVQSKLVSVPLDQLCRLLCLSLYCILLHRVHLRNILIFSPWTKKWHYFYVVQLNVEPFESPRVGAYSGSFLRKTSRWICDNFMVKVNHKRSKKNQCEKNKKIVIHTE